jgi:peptidyl-prolyl cis-trans isomerase C
MKRGIVPAVRFALVLLLPAAMSACGGGGSAGSAGNANSTIRLADPGPAAETVNGEDVPERLLQAYARTRNLDLSRPDIRQRALRDLANIVVTAQAARDEKLYENPEFAATAEMMRLQSLATATTAQLQRSVTAVDDAAVRAEYDKLTQTNAGTDYAFTQLVFRDEATAKKVAAEIAKGKPFDKAWEEHKADALQARRFQNIRTRQMPEPLANAIEAMKPGDVSKAPVETPLGFHIVHLEAATQHPQEPFDTVKERIRGVLQKRAAEEKLMKLRTDAKIVVAPAPAGAAPSTPAPEKKPAGGDAKKP